MTARHSTDALPLITNNPLPLKPPFEFGGVSARVLPLRANLNALQRLCDGYLNFMPPEVGRIRAVVPYVYLMLLDYGRLAELLTNLGWFAQRELFFCVPVQWYRVVNGRWIFHDWAVITPFIYVDDDLSVPLGRTVYGWPKTIARLTPTLSHWIEHPLATVSEAHVHTMVFPELYQGRRLESRPFLEVQRDPMGTPFRTPPDVRSPLMPWMVALNLADAALGLSRDLMGLLNGFGIFPVNDAASASNFSAIGAQMANAFGPRFPGMISNTLNLKQFRRSDCPEHFCYQAVTNGRLQVTAFNGGGFMGEDRLFAGDLSGGFAVKLHEWPSLPIVETLGLDVVRRWQGDDVSVAMMKPVLPFWYNVNMVYLQGINVAWRSGDDGIWRNEAGDQIDPHATPAPRDSSCTVFNTTVGSAVDALAGPFQFSGTTIRVLPLLARRRKLEGFLKSYINDSLGSGEARNVRLTLWAAPARAVTRDSDDIEGNDAEGQDYGYVYLTATSFQGVTSKTNNIGDWAKFELAFLVPVKYECWNATTHKWEVEGVGLVPAYTFVDDTTAAVARAEVLGIPTTRAMFVQPESAWMSEEGGDAGAPQLLLRVNAEVLPAMGEGQQSQIHPIIDISQGDYNAGMGWLESRVTADRWSAILRQELERKKRTKQQNSKEMQNARALALELLGNHVPFALYTMKQFRDVVDPDRACYQSIVRVSRVLDQVVDLREIEQTIRVRIHDFPTQPLVETLGIVGKTIKDDGAGIVYGTQAIRPFTIRVQMDEKLGERLLSRVGTIDWRLDYKQFPSILSGNPPITVGLPTVQAQDRGDARRIERNVRDYAAEKREADPLSVADAKRVIEAIDPQMVVESVLSREWGNWSEHARWRRGRRELERDYEETVSGASPDGLMEAQISFFERVKERAGHRPGEPPISDACEMISALALISEKKLELEKHWAAVTESYMRREPGTRKVKHETRKAERRAMPSTLDVQTSIKALIDGVESIADLEVKGDPTAPNAETDFEDRNNHARLKELLASKLRPPPSPPSPASPRKRSRRPNSGPLEERAVPSDEPRIPREVYTNAVMLAQKRCVLQLEAVFNKVSRAWQKPDFCVKRDAAGSERDRLFPLAESWDEDWYYGRAVSKAVTPKPKKKR